MAKFFFTSALLQPNFVLDNKCKIFYDSGTTAQPFSPTGQMTVISQVCEIDLQG